MATQMAVGTKFSFKAVFTDPSGNPTNIDRPPVGQVDPTAESSDPAIATVDSFTASDQGGDGTGTVVAVGVAQIRIKADPSRTPGVQTELVIMGEVEGLLPEAVAGRVDITPTP